MLHPLKEKSCFSFLGMEFSHIIILLINILHVTKPSFEPSTIDTGIAFIEMGKAAITHTTWQLCYYYDLEDYFNQINRIEEAISDIKTLCGFSPEKKECEILLELLENHMENSKYNAERVESFQNAKRKKRAPLGYLGDLNAYLFGYMTQEDGEEIAKKIEKIRTKVLKHQDLFEQQISIIEQSVNINNKTYNDFKRGVTELSKNINDFEKNVEINKKIGVLTDIATLIIMSHSQISNTIMNILQNSVNGKIINLISQKQIKKDLQNIVENLKNNQKLPINLKMQHAYNIFAVTTSKATLLNKKILIKINIPIIERDELILYRTVPIPTAVDDKLIIILPTTKYFLFNNNKREITPINYEEITQCHKTLKKELLCAPEAATIINKDASCELTLITDLNREAVQKICEFRFVPKKNYFIQITQNNEYYCIIHTPLLITESCPEENIHTMSIVKNGKIKLKPGCTITTNEIKITAPLIKINEPEILKPIFRFSKLNENSILEITGNISYLTERNYSMIILEDYNNEIVEMSEKIKQTIEKSKEKLNMESLVEDNKSDIYSTLVLIGIGILILVVFYQKCLK